MDKETLKLVAGALAIVAGSNATGILNAYNPNIRADAFTMTKWLQEKEKLNKRFSDHIFAEHQNNELIRNRLLECEFNLRK